LDLLERLLQAAEDGGRNGSVIEILILQSLAHQAQGNQPRALAALERALALAEPEGYVHVFADEGEPMRSLLRLLIEKWSRNRDQLLIGYAHKLLAAFTQPEETPKSAVLHHKSGMNEPLSEREFEVLRLLGTEMSGPEIARELMVSLNTMYTHTKSIYNKLGVNNRRMAIRQAEELHLL
jgi:LuxR family maltose regulon positive regulatory protein